MENSVDILDQNLVITKPDILPALASGSKRFANFILDTVAVYAILFIVAFILGIAGQGDLLASTPFDYLLYFSIFFAYFVFCENYSGKTLGKLITRTKVISIDGEKPESGKIWLRTLCRLIPFEAFTFLGNGEGLHDRLSKTQVVLNN